MTRILPLSEAVAQLVRDGDTVALEGFTHLIPYAAGHELIRQSRCELTLVRMTPDLIYDQLIGAGCARKLIFSGGGNPGVGSLHRLRDAVERSWANPLELEEHSHAGIATDCREVFVLLRQSTRTFVEMLDFLTSAGSRVSVVVTDLGVLEPDATGELRLTHVHPGVRIEDVSVATGWDLRVLDLVKTTAPPSESELSALRNLERARSRN